MAMYRKKQLQFMLPWKENMKESSEFFTISISDADRKNGSPKIGDMIAFNHKDPSDQWLVAEKFFNDNYELVKE